MPTQTAATALLVITSFRPPSLSNFTRLPKIRTADNMRFQLIACLLASLAAASPQPNRNAECKETAVERLHQGHNHNVNKAKIQGAINLPLPGGSNCWHGKKIGGANAE